MKKYIKATQYMDSMEYTRNGTRFRVYMNDCSEDQPICKFQIAEIHPYDDADYAYAVCDGVRIKYYRPLRKNDFILNAPRTQLIDQETIFDYDPDDWEDYNDYLREIIDETCVNLLGYNKNVKPIIMHD